MSDAARRLVVVVALVAVFGGIAVVDRVVGRGAGSTPPSTVSAQATDRVAPVGVGSSAWYCAGGPSTGGGTASTLLLVNSGPAPVGGTVSILAAGTATTSVPVAVPARASATVPLESVATTALAASVVLDGGGVGAWEEIDGPSGWSVAPCASSMSAQWYFAHGSTRTGDSFALTLYNPAATDAVVDTTLVTSTEGLVAPAAYQGVDVAARSVVTEDVEDHVQDDPAIAAEVTALSGSLVAFELQTTGQPGQSGWSLLLGSPGPTRRSAFAQSTDPSGGALTYYVVNPSPDRVAVSAAVGLQHGSTAPFTLQVPGQGMASLDTADQPRIPSATPYAMSFTCSGGGVIVVRVVAAPSSEPAPQVGFTSAVAAGPTRWLVPAVPSPGTGAWYLAVTDLAGRPVSVAVRSAGRTGWRRVHLATGRLEPGVPLLVGPTPAPPVGTAPLEVAASGPVAVQLDAQPAGGPGVVVIPALALG